MCHDLLLQRDAPVPESRLSIISARLCESLPTLGTTAGGGEFGDIKKLLDSR
jgi:hypothetical protein